MSVHRTARTRRTAGTRGALAGSLAIAALVHVGLAAGATSGGLLGGWSFGALPEAARAEARATPRPPLRPSCDADALLVAGARGLLCAGPFVDDQRRCLVDVGNRLESDRLRCHLDQLEAALVSVAPIDVSRIPTIDPELLLDEEEQLKPAPPPDPELITLAALQPPPPPPPPPPQATPPPPPRDEQIVEVAQRPTEDEPVDSRFLAEVNSRVERQTVARGSVAEPMTVKPADDQLKVVPDPRDPSASKPPDVEGQRPDAPRAPSALSMRAAGPRKPSEVAQDARTVGPLDGATGPRGVGGTRAARGNSLFAAEARQRAISPGEDGGGGGSRAIPDLRASDDVLERAAGGGSVDHLDDVDAGDETQLNSRQFVYASFFNRTKRSVAQQWHPGEVWQRHDPTLAINGLKDRTTRVRVTLSPSGELLKIIVIEPSGVSYLDDEAIRAFRLAQPFPNPPPGLVNEGAIVFTFGFHVSVNGNRTEWKFFRE